MSPLTALTYVLPHRLLSSLARKLAYSTDPKTFGGEPRCHPGRIVRRGRHQSDDDL